MTPAHRARRWSPRTVWDMESVESFGLLIVEACGWLGPEQEAIARWGVRSNADRMVSDTRVERALAGVRRRPVGRWRAPDVAYE